MWALRSSTEPYAHILVREGVSTNVIPRTLETKLSGCDRIHIVTEQEMLAFSSSQDEPQRHGVMVAMKCGATSDRSIDPLQAESSVRSSFSSQWNRSHSNSVAATDGAVMHCHNITHDQLDQSMTIVVKHISGAGGGL
jgi:hypothetical protein